MIYGVDGQFASWKTSYVVKIASQLPPGSIIFTNIKMDRAQIPNVFEFPWNFMGLLTVLREINLINDLERYAFTYPKENSTLRYYPRDRFTRFYLFFDESGSSMNASDYKKFDTVLCQYIDQNRKNFENIWLCSADGASNFKGLRKYVDWWYYSKPFMNLPVLNHIKVIRRQKREEDWKTLKLEQFIGLDQNQDMVIKQRPIDEYVDWYWQPKVWSLYDDLDKVITDPDKYKNLDLQRVSQVFQANPYLARVVKKKPEFSFLRESIDIDTIALLSPQTEDRYENPLDLDDYIDVFEEEEKQDNLEKSQLNIWQAEKDIG